MIEELRQSIEEKREELKIHQFGFMTTDQIAFSPGVRDMCAVNYCGKYGTSWCCPPAVGTYEECRDKILQYKDMFVYTTKHDLEDSYDFEGMMEGKDAHAEVSKEVIRYFRTLHKGDMLILSGDGCNRCEKCTYPDAPCRFPEETYPSVESYGVEVNRIAKTLHINYINGANTVTYFSCIMFND